MFHFDQDNLIKSQMKLKPPLVLLLACTALVFSFIVFRIGNFVPRFFAVSYKLRPDEVANFMHIPTRLASEYAWLFGLALLLILVVTILTLRRCPANSIEIAVVSLCAQGAMVWIAMFCFFCEAFCGPISLHTPAQFSLVKFVQFEGGVFPISLAGLAAPIIFLLVTRFPTNAESESVSCQQQE